MPASNIWTRQQLLVAFWLYCQMPFGKMHSRNPQIIKFAALLGRTPSALAMKLTNIASLDPQITAMWKEMQSDWNAFEHISGQAVEEILNGGSSSETLLELEETDYTGENRTVQSTARRGQNFFRNAVLTAYDFKCCISGLSVQELLVASHIVPWAVDPSNRKNPANGLALSALHDKAFDLGLITVRDDFTVRVSDKGSSDSDFFYMTAVKSYEGKQIAKPEKFLPHSDFLAFHREHVFEKLWR
jgi:predicted restriction endonuclease